MPEVDKPSLIVRYLGCRDYPDTYHAMKQFTQSRNSQTTDEIWLLEHQPVFTQGQAGKEEHVLLPGDIPVVLTDRGGQVTYHGPGQITAYLMMDLKRLRLGVRDFVSLVEQALIVTLQTFSVDAHTRTDAPGVYVESGQKIGSLGFKVRRGYTYHGLNFNVDMDLNPWQRINPCGLGVPMTQLADQIETTPNIDDVAKILASHLATKLGYNSHTVAGEPDHLKLHS